jgi:hypothetical protein
VHILSWKTGLQNCLVTFVMFWHVKMCTVGYSRCSGGVAASSCCCACRGLLIFMYLFWFQLFKHSVL